ncbi:non-canonical purine NTP pyrophosphatase [Phycisphaerales bacterium AB-hyl4]|uniref:dITP/XTP pyrophosphatase n=1 Tax=Natronomicrosphaera hydrolytica TaxID=3242702 RepID=A0ABV4U5S8_9BACT
MNESDRRILLATGNPHKLDELQAIFDACGGKPGGGDGGGGRGVRLTSLQALDVQIVEPVEDGDTFEANAIKKARHYASATGMLCMADDSGLEVDALNGEPGVLSARYSGATGERGEVDLANNRRLLKRLGNTPPAERTARFVCTIAMVAPATLAEERWLAEVLQQLDPSEGDGRLLAMVRGTIEGRILLPSEAADRDEPERGRGANGFGYDPLFLVPELGCTTAELPASQKNRISHRGNAARAMYEKLLGLGLV